MIRRVAYSPVAILMLSFAGPAFADVLPEHLGWSVVGTDDMARCVDVLGLSSDGETEAYVAYNAYRWELQELQEFRATVKTWLSGWPRDVSNPRRTGPPYEVAIDDLDSSSVALLRHTQLSEAMRRESIVLEDELFQALESIASANRGKLSSLRDAFHREQLLTSGRWTYPGSVVGSAFNLAEVVRGLPEDLFQGEALGHELAAFERALAPLLQEHAVWAVPATSLYERTLSRQAGSEDKAIAVSAMCQSKALSISSRISALNRETFTRVLALTVDSRARDVASDAVLAKVVPQLWWSQPRLEMMREPTGEDDENRAIILERHDRVRRRAALAIWEAHLELQSPERVYEDALADLQGDPDHEAWRARLDQTVREIRKAFERDAHDCLGLLGLDSAGLLELPTDDGTNAPSIPADVAAGFRPVISADAFATFVEGLSDPETRSAVELVYQDFVEEYRRAVSVVERLFRRNRQLAQRATDALDIESQMAAIDAANSDWDDTFLSEWAARRPQLETQFASDIASLLTAPKDLGLWSDLVRNTRRMAFLNDQQQGRLTSLVKLVPLLNDYASPADNVDFSDGVTEFTVAFDERITDLWRRHAGAAPRLMQLRERAAKLAAEGSIEQAREVLTEVGVRMQRRVDELKELRQFAYETAISLGANLGGDAQQDYWNELGAVFYPEVFRPGPADVILHEVAESPVFDEDQHRVFQAIGEMHRHKASLIQRNYIDQWEQLADPRSRASRRSNERFWMWVQNAKEDPSYSFHSTTISDSWRDLYRLHRETCNHLRERMTPEQFQAMPRFVQVALNEMWGEFSPPG